MPTKTKKVAKKSVKTTKKVSKPKPDHHVEVRVNDMVYKGEGMNFFDVLQEYVKSPNYPFAVKTKVYFRFSNKDGVATRSYFNPRANRMFKRLAFSPKEIQNLVDVVNKQLNS